MPGDAVLDDLSTAELRSLETRAQEALSAACSQAATNKQIVDCISKLSSSSNLLQEFNAVSYVTPNVAEQVLQLAIAALINAQSCLAVEAELRRRANLN